MQEIMKFGSQEDELIDAFDTIKVKKSFLFHYFHVVDYRFIARKYTPSSLLAKWRSFRKVWNKECGLMLMGEISKKGFGLHKKISTFYRDSQHISLRLQ